MADWYATHPTPAELAAVLGTGWAICPKTPANRARYARCLSRAEYVRACAEAMRRREGR